jgi:hypothetical protein
MRLDVFEVFTVGMVLLISASVLQGCEQPPTLRPDDPQDAYVTQVNKDLVKFSPRSGVECYVLRGQGPTNPRAMSCVTLPTEMEP